MTLDDIKQFKIKIQSEDIPLSVKYEYLKGLSQLLEIYEYSFFACEEQFRILKVSFQNEKAVFNQKINIIHHYLKENKNFLNLKKDSLIYKWLLDNVGVLMVMQHLDLRAYDIVSELKLEKHKEFPVSDINDKYIYRLKQLVDHLRNYGDLPVQTDKNFKFEDGVYMGRFIAHNKRKIMMLKEGNEYAFELASYFEKKNLSFDEKLKEVYEYLVNYGKLPFTSDNEVKFSNGEVMSTWFSHNRKKISLMNNYMAKEITKHLNGRKLKFTDKLDELYNYYILNDFIPSVSSREVFSDGSLMGGFVKENKDNLIKVSEVDSRAKEILVFLSSKKLNDEEKIKEAYLYLESNGELPAKSNKKVCFSDGSYMGYWLREHYNDLVNNNDEYSKKLIKYFEFLESKALTRDDKLNEVYNYLLKYNHLPSRRALVYFSNGEVMNYWFGHNLDRLRLSDDNRAQTIINYLGSQKGISFEEKVAELYTKILDEEFRITNESIFSDGVNIKGWLRDNKKRLELLKEESDVVLLIWKKCFKLSFEEKVMEFYEYLILYNKIPFQSDREALFSDGTFIGMWISNNKRRIYLDDSLNMLKEKMEEINPCSFNRIKKQNVLKK